VPLVVAGTVFSGLGLFTVLASGVTWLVAWGDSRRLEDECYGRYCVEGTPGGERYKDVRDLANASEILVGVGVPLMFGGLAITIIGASLRGEYDGPRIGATVRPNGAALEVRF
jgi:hypothetical protein